jgi:hypothetical protein
MDSPRFPSIDCCRVKSIFVGGCCTGKWVDPLDYRNAAPDILAQQAGLSNTSISTHF